jgi:hypothetical protein
MSFYGMAFLGMVPFGSLLTGFLASHIGAPRTMMFNGAVCVLASLVYARRLPAIQKDAGWKPGGRLKAWPH